MSKIINRLRRRSQYDKEIVEYNKIIRKIVNTDKSLERGKMGSIEFIEALGIAGKYKVIPKKTDSGWEVDIELNIQQQEE